MNKEKNSEWTDEEKIELVLEILAGEMTVAEAAGRHALDPAEIESCKGIYLRGLKQGLHSGKGSALGRLSRAVRRRPLTLSGAVLSVLLLLAFLVPLTALSETPEGCTDADSPDLCRFSAGEPAVANEVNSNFAKIVSWLEKKVGSVTEVGVTVNDGLQVNGGLQVNDGLQVSQVRPNPGEPITFYADDSSTDSVLSVESDGFSGHFKSILLGDEVAISRNNTDGDSDPLDLGLESNRFCFLTYVQFEDLDTYLESAKCEVYIDGGRWKFRAGLGNPDATNDADAWCKARCVTW
jgi:hypothetical protein